MSLSVFVDQTNYLFPRKIYKLLKQLTTEPKIEFINVLQNFSKYQNVKVTRRLPIKRLRFTRLPQNYKNNSTFLLIGH